MKCLVLILLVLFGVQCWPHIGLGLLTVDKLDAITNVTGETLDVDLKKDGLNVKRHHKEIEETNDSNQNNTKTDTNGSDSNLHETSETNRSHTSKGVKETDSNQGISLGSGGLTMFDDKKISDEKTAEDKEFSKNSRVERQVTASSEHKDVYENSNAKETKTHDRHEDHERRGLTLGGGGMKMDKEKNTKDRHDVEKREEGANTKQTADYRKTEHGMKKSRSLQKSKYSYQSQESTDNSREQNESKTLVLMPEDFTERSISPILHQISRFQRSIKDKTQPNIFGNLDQITFRKRYIETLKRKIIQANQVAASQTTPFNSELSSYKNNRNDVINKVLFFRYGFQNTEIPTPSLISDSNNDQYSKHRQLQTYPRKENTVNKTPSSSNPNPNVQNFPKSYHKDFKTFGYSNGPRGLAGHGASKYSYIEPFGYGPRGQNEPPLDNSHFGISSHWTKLNDGLRRSSSDRYVGPDFLLHTSGEKSSEDSTEIHTVLSPAIIIRPHQLETEPTIKQKEESSEERYIIGNNNAHYKPMKYKENDFVGELNMELNNQRKYTILVDTNKVYKKNQYPIITSKDIDTINNKKDNVNKKSDTLKTKEHHNNTSSENDYVNDIENDSDDLEYIIEPIDLFDDYEDDELDTFSNPHAEYKQSDGIKNKTIEEEELSIDRKSIDNKSANNTVIYNAIAKKIRPLINNNVLYIRRKHSKIDKHKKIDHERKSSDNNKVNKIRDKPARKNIRKRNAIPDTTEENIDNNFKHELDAYNNFNENTTASVTENNKLVTVKESVKGNTIQQQDVDKSEISKSEFKVKGDENYVTIISITDVTEKSPTITSSILSTVINLLSMEQSVTKSLIATTETIKHKKLKIDEDFKSITISDKELSDAASKEIDNPSKQNRDLLLASELHLKPDPNVKIERNESQDIKITNKIKDKRLKLTNDAKKTKKLTETETIQTSTENNDDNSEPDIKIISKHDSNLKNNKYDKSTKINETSLEKVAQNSKIFKTTPNTVTILNNATTLQVETTAINNNTDYITQYLHNGKKHNSKTIKYNHSNRCRLQNFDMRRKNKSLAKVLIKKLSSERTYKNYNRNHHLNINSYSKRLNTPQNNSSNSNNEGKISEYLWKPQSKNNSTEKTPENYRKPFFETQNEGKGIGSMLEKDRYIKTHMKEKDKENHGHSGLDPIINLTDNRKRVTKASVYEKKTHDVEKNNTTKINHEPKINDNSTKTNNSSKIVLHIQENKGKIIEKLENTDANNETSQEVPYENVKISHVLEINENLPRTKQPAQQTVKPKHHRRQSDFYDSEEAYDHDKEPKNEDIPETDKIFEKYNSKSYEDRTLKSDNQSKYDKNYDSRLGSRKNETVSQHKEETPHGNKNSSQENENTTQIKEKLQTNHKSNKRNNSETTKAQETTVIMKKRDRIYNSKHREERQLDSHYEYEEDKLKGKAQHSKIKHVTEKYKLIRQWGKKLHHENHKSKHHPTDFDLDIDEDKGEIYDTNDDKAHNKSKPHKTKSGKVESKAHERKKEKFRHITDKIRGEMIKLDSKKSANQSGLQNSSELINEEEEDVETNIDTDTQENKTKNSKRNKTSQSIRGYDHATYERRRKGQKIDSESKRKDHKNTQDDRSHKNEKRKNNNLKSRIAPNESKNKGGRSDNERIPGKWYKADDKYTNSEQRRDRVEEFHDESYKKSIEDDFE